MRLQKSGEIIEIICLLLINGFNKDALHHNTKENGTKKTIQPDIDHYSFYIFNKVNQNLWRVLDYFHLMENYDNYDNHLIFCN